MNIYLIPVYGFVGAAIATSTSLVIVNIISVNQNYKILDLQWFNKDVLKLSLYSVLCITCITFILNYCHNWNLHEEITVACFIEKVICRI